MVEYIICPDCLENSITQYRMNKYGKCLSCYRREIVSKSFNREYIPYKDLSDKEKERLSKQRISNNRNKIKTSNGVLSNKKISDKNIIKKFLDNKKFLDSEFVSIKSTDLYNSFKDFCAKNKYNVVPKLKFYKSIVQDFGFTKKMSRGDNYYYLGDYKGKTFVKATEEQFNTNDKVIYDVNKSPRKVRDNQIYTFDRIEFIKDVASKELLSINELMNIMIDKYKDDRINKINFSNIIARHFIPHSRYMSNSKKLDLMQKNIRDDSDNDVDKILKDMDIEDESLEELKDVVVENVEVVADNNSDKTSSVTENIDDRLGPIKSEVLNILNTKFSAMKCQTSYNVAVEDYIHIFELLEYLSNNIDDLIKLRSNQYDLANLYQDDIIHEMENELAETGNTYLQDKMHVLRDIRRFIESDRNALKLIKPILSKLKLFFNSDNNTKVIAQLKSLASNNKKPKFIPTVDFGMVSKYDWATFGSSDSAKNNKKVFVTNDLEKYLEKSSDDFKTVKLKGTTKYKNLIDKPTTVVLSKEEISNGLGVYRVSCELSGGGYGVFNRWYKDYPCINEDIAKSFAQQELARMKSANSSLLVTNLQVKRLNVV